MKSGKAFYVYAFFLPDGSPCWIGKGSGDRYKDHGYGSHNKEFAAILRGAKALGVELPVVIVRDDLTHREALELETLLITAIGRRPDGPLVNKSAGSGFQGTAIPADVREKQRRAKLDMPPEKRVGWLEKLSRAKLGRRQPPEVVQKRLARHIGSRWINDGERNARLKSGEALPEGWRFGRCDAVMRGRTWITDGARNRRITNDERLPDGWRIGITGSFGKRDRPSTAKLPRSYMA